MPFTLFFIYNIYFPLRLDALQDQLRLAAQQLSHSPAVLQLNEDPSWLTEQTTLDAAYSITHLEIVTGVLRVPADQRRALVYMRDPSYLERLPPQERANHVSSEPQLQVKLAQLTTDLSQAANVTLRYYTEPEALPQLIFDDVMALTQQDFPMQSAADPFEQERANHQAFAMSRMENFVRLERLVQLAQALTDMAVAAPAALQVIHGSSGTGKSSLMAFMATQLQQEPDVLVAMHFVGHTAHSANQLNMLHVREKGGSVFWPAPVLSQENLTLPSTSSQSDCCGRFECGRAEPSPILYP